ncbi:transcriptional regulator [Caballeronia sp. LZ035]|uniref:helix-turn-helix transcriptional regulator n=1 Tax=Caballeronia sp. LZ035 TaxID=3038568 RepID=UPI00285CB602|nr:transcriptional regulator [Caballeronia sp. LZ035]MDR5756354.1 transcriptional regulator [Caballeronia sp. LZ035]
MINVEIRNFDSLPAAAGVRVQTVAALCSCSVSAVWNRSKRGDLPKPRNIGGHALWNVGELRAVLLGEPA